MLSGAGSDLDSVVVLRLPRLVLAILAGACLAVAGALLQDTLRNPLAGPELLGVSWGAGLVVAGTIIFHLRFLPPCYRCSAWPAGSSPAAS